MKVSHDACELSVCFIAFYKDGEPSLGGLHVEAKGMEMGHFLAH